MKKPIRLPQHCRLGVTVLLSAASWPITVVSATGAPQSAFEARDVFALKGVQDVRISPDGRRVAYVAVDTDIMIDGRHRSIRLVDVASLADRLLADDAFSPCWSPDGRLIAYLARDAAGHTQIYTMHADGSGRQVVTDVPTAPSEIAWSPDGRTLAFLMFVADPPVPPPQPPVSQPAGAKWALPPRIVTTLRYQSDGQTSIIPGHVQLFSVPASGGPAMPLTSGDADIEGTPAWSGAGDALVVTSRRGEERARSYTTARLYRVPAAGGELVPISPMGLGAREPATSMHSRKVAFIAVRPQGRDYEPSGLYVMNEDGSEMRRLLSTLDREVEEPRWAPDGRSLYVSYADRSIRKIARVLLDGTIKVRASGSGNGYSIGRGDTLAYPAGAADRPVDVVVRQARSGEQRLTRRNEVLLASKALASVRSLTVRSALDGQPVGAWLIVPPRFDPTRRYPLIVSLHGGPYGYDGPTWNISDQLYAAAGYAVLHPNYRGSISYGFAFADRVGRDFPEPAFRDVMTTVDAAIAAGVADPDRLYITGGSAGGQLTTWAVGSTNRFKAAVAEKPVINALSKALTTDQYLGSISSYGVQPWDDPDRYWKSSPLSLVSRVTTPTMLIVGAEDRRTPPTESQQYYNALNLRGVPSALVIIPDASHASLGSRPSQLLWEIALTLDWFGHHGGGTLKDNLAPVSIRLKPSK